jgi:hypothetical protein
MDRKHTNQPQQPSLEEEVQRVLRAGEQAKHAEEEETFGATATARERIQDWSGEAHDTTRAAVDRVKGELDEIGDEAHIRPATLRPARSIRPTAPSVRSTTPPSALRILPETLSRPLAQWQIR